MILELLHILENPHLYAAQFVQNGEIVIKPIAELPNSARVITRHNRTQTHG
jgi:hypothetical protein